MAGVRGTDHIYGSGNRSVVDNNMADRKGRPGEPVLANPSYDGSINKSSADKYYRNLGSQGSAVMQPVAVGVGSANEPDIVLADESEFGGVVDKALERVRATNRPVKIQVLNTGLSKRLGAQFDMLQHKESISAVQRQLIVIGRPVELMDAQAVESLITDKTPTTAAPADDDLATGLDMDAYIKGELADDVLDPAPAAQVEDTDDEDTDDDPAAGLTGTVAASKEPEDDYGFDDLDEPPEDTDDESS